MEEERHDKNNNGNNDDNGEDYGVNTSNPAAPTDSSSRETSRMSMTKDRIRGQRMSTSRFYQLSVLSRFMGR